MSGLNSLYVIAPGLEMYFVDKDTGLPLAGGQVYFYQDNSRTTLKNVFEISGTPPNYSYTALPNPVTLSAVGTFADSSGNDIIPYYYPYDSSGNIQLYYIAVYSSTGVLQWTREGWPNTTLTSINSQSDVTNFIPNSQFLLHNSTQLAPVPVPYGIYTNDVNQIAPGGWTFEKATSSTATDVISFTRATQATSNPTGSPRYSVSIARTNHSSEFCDIRIKFNDVNKFATLAGAPYTFLFTAQSTSGSSLGSCQVALIQYFGSGSGATTTTDTQIGSNFSITTSEQQFAFPITFTLNSSNTIGPNDDDFIQLAVRFPGGTNFNVVLTSFDLVFGTVTSSNIFPPITNGQFVLEALSNIAPTNNPGNNAYYAEDGSNLGLPLIMTLSGFSYDYSRIGDITSSIYTKSYASGQGFPKLLCDGMTYFVNSATITNNYSTIGIPYYRLLKVLINNSPLANTPMYGTGLNYVTAYQTNNTSVMRLTVNTAGTATAAQDNNTLFTITSIHTGGTAGAFTAYNNIANTVLVVGNFSGSPHAAASAQTSGFSITTNSINTGLLAFQAYSFTIATVVPSAGQYFYFSNSTTDFYMWFKVNGSGSDPGPFGSRVSIELDLLSTYSAQDVANCIREAINNFQMSTISVSSIPTAGTYWTFSNQGNTNNYYVWYSYSSAMDPAPSNMIGIPVILNGSENAAQVVTKTLIAINTYQYAVPNFQGMFLRGLDPNGTWDIDYLQRWSTVSNLSGANLGTFEFDQFLSHTHPIVYSGGGGLSSADANVTGQTTQTINTNSSGGMETRPVNAAVNFFIYY